MVFAGLKSLCFCELGNSKKWSSCFSEKLIDCIGTVFNANPYFAPVVLIRCYFEFNRGCSVNQTLVLLLLL